MRFFSNGKMHTIQGGGIAQLDYGPEDWRFKPQQLLMFHYSAVYLNSRLIEYFQIIHMCQMVLILGNIALIKTNLLKACLHT